ncbi:uncharacterized protein LOC117123024 [Anneissia japonica]|uniref:uncharacterized protein LOC117123024 n=1 Tax=Anneissia japonica TaxID=1529436 RepID=UPI00142583EF|nr:uncharacterized protein LOC117123024 [Anneissia japonica]
MFSFLWSLVFTTLGIVSFTYAADGDVRLVGRPRTYMGRVEIEMGSTWYSICEEGWGIEEADVVCRQLGFPEGAMFSSVSPRSDFGIGTGDMLWSDYNCTGTEPNLLSCDSGANLNSDDCSINQDVAIICNVPAYLGCYEIAEGTYPPNLKRVSSASESIEACLGVCRLHSMYAALGVQGDNNRCFCFSGDYTTLTTLSNDRCNTECTDDSRAACGGVNAYSIYPVTLGAMGAVVTDAGNGSIYSPNFFGDYQPGLDTTWTLSFTENNIVTVEFIMFLLDGGDTLTVSDGISTNTYGNNQASPFTWTSGSTRTVTLQFISASDSDGGYGFLLTYLSTTSGIPIVTTKVATTKPATTVVTTRVTTNNIVTTKKDETTISDSTTSKTTEADEKTTSDTTIADGTERTEVTKPVTTKVTTKIETDVTTVTASATTTITTDVPDNPTTLMETDPACPVFYGSSDLSNEGNTASSDQLILAYGAPFKCDTVVTDVSLHALSEATYTLFVLRQSEDDFQVVSKAVVTSTSTNSVVDEELTSSSTVVAKAGDFVAIAYKAGTFSFSENHGGTMNFTVFDTSYSNFDTIAATDVLDLPDSSMDVKRQYPFQLTMRPAKVCDLTSDVSGGSYDVSSLLEGQMTTLICYDSFEAKRYDDSDEYDYNYINVTCTSNGLRHSGICREKTSNTTYIVIFTTIVGCLGFCLVFVYCAILCSKQDKTSGGVDEVDEKTPSDKNVLIQIDDPEDNVDSPAAEAQEEDGTGENNDVPDGDSDGEQNDEPDEEPDGQADGEQSNTPSSAGEVGGVDNPVYQSNEWVPEVAGPED